MNQRRHFLAVVVLTLAAWGCFEAMEIVPDNSLTETVLFITAFILCGLALYAFFNALRSPKP